MRIMISLSIRYSTESVIDVLMKKEIEGEEGERREYL
jgi:hypothetical protein